LALKAARRSAIAPFIVMDVLRAATARDRAARGPGERAVHLEIGQPGEGAPAAVLDAAARALREDRLGYTETLGLPRLRERIAAHYRAVHGIDVPAGRVVVTTGSSGAFILAFLAAFDAGDRVAIADPGYPAYRNILSALGVEVVGIPADAGDRYQPTIERLEAAGRLDGLIVASPANPTGTMLGASQLAALGAWCARRGVRLVSDEIYHGIVYGEPAASAAAIAPEAIVINSFSKYFAMTGWRLGWMVVPEDLLRPVEVLAQNLFISPPSLPQHAAIAAFDCVAELDARVGVYRANRDLLLRELPRAGFSTFAPADGAFYLYCDVGHMTNDSAEFCRRMLDQAGVAATPGTDFDPGRGARHVRFSFAGSPADMAEACARLRRWRAAAG
jgi:aspartate/methionine/tyrosine aminotransferase